MHKLYNFFIVKPFFHFCYQVSFSLLDKGFIEVLGPYGLTNKINQLAHKLTQLQTGLVYHYTLFALVGLCGSITLTRVFLGNFIISIYESLAFFVFMFCGIFFF